MFELEKYGEENMKRAKMLNEKEVSYSRFVAQLAIQKGTS